jgi:YopX protein
MREIKFRAWDKEEKKMYEVGLLDCQRMQIMPPAPDEQAILERHNDIDLMQYTGLKDKNGKEIYEGDILINHFYFDNNSEKPQAVSWGEAEWLMGKLALNSNNTEYLEVIGNIYSNPELLQ